MPKHDHDIHEAELRRIETLIVKLTPLEKRKLSSYMSIVGIKNVSDWVRCLMFDSIERDLEEYNF